MPYSAVRKRNLRKAERNKAGARFVKSWRRRMGLTQKQAGKLIGAAPITLSRWERGNVRVSPAWRTIMLIAERSPALLKPSTARGRNNGRVKAK